MSSITNLKIKEIILIQLHWASESNAESPATDTVVLLFGRK